MKRALCLIREDLVYRRDLFRAGLEANGFTWVSRIDVPTPADVLVIWNRYGAYHQTANRFEAAKAQVIVAENGYLGRKLHGMDWYAMSLNNHNGAGTWHEGGPERWDSLGIELAPWREGGREVVLLPQRGIGPPGVAMPKNWTYKARQRVGSCRVRPHPGEGPCVPLDQDLKNAKSVVVWGSGAGIKALIMGIPVQYEMPNWIGAPAASKLGQPLFRGDRLPCLRRLAWAMWNEREIGSGQAFHWLLEAAGRPAS